MHQKTDERLANFSKTAQAESEVPGAGRGVYRRSGEKLLSLGKEAHQSRQ